MKKKIHGTFNMKNRTRRKSECQNLCFCNQEYIWVSVEENITDLGSWKKCSHCKKQHEYYLNYKSENNSLL